MFTVFCVALTSLCITLNLPLLMKHALLIKQPCIAHVQTYSGHIMLQQPKNTVQMDSTEQLMGIN